MEKETKPTRRTFSIRLGEPQILTLRKMANAQESSVSAIIRKMVNDCISRENKKR